MAQQVYTPDARASAVAIGTGTDDINLVVPARLRGALLAMGPTPLQQALVTAIDTALGNTAWQSGGGGGTMTGAQIVAALDAHFSSPNWALGYPTDAQIVSAINAHFGSTNWSLGYPTPAQMVAAIDLELGSTNWQQGSGSGAMTGTQIVQALNSQLGSATWQGGAMTGAEVNAALNTFFGNSNWSLGYPTPAQMVAAINLELGGTTWQGGGGGGGGATNLSVTTAASTVTVVSDTGTDAAIPAATTSAAGVMTSTQATKLAAAARWNATEDKLLKADGTEVSLGSGSGATNLSVTGTASEVTVASDTGTDAVLPAATSVAAGVMTAAQVQELAAAVRWNGTETGLLKADNSEVPLRRYLGEFTWATKPLVSTVAANSIILITDLPTPTEFIRSTSGLTWEPRSRIKVFHGQSPATSGNTAWRTLAAATLPAFFMAGRHLEVRTRIYKNPTGGGTVEWRLVINGVDALIRSPGLAATLGFAQWWAFGYAPDSFTFVATPPDVSSPPYGQLLGAFTSDYLQKTINMGTAVNIELQIKASSGADTVTVSEYVLFLE